MSFRPADPKLFFSRNDLNDPRLGDLVKALPVLPGASDLEDTMSEGVSPAARHFVLAGYMDDEGIRTNGGRLGAAQAPTEVRRALYKMTPALWSRHAAPAAIWDLGDLPPSSGDGHDLQLAERHALASDHVLAALTSGASWIGVGGGHDYGFADGDGFCRWVTGDAAGAPSARPLVINFDAHLDVRPTDRGISSGTPFFRLLEKYPEIDFAEIGIQAHCNSRAHDEWARARGARILTQEEVETSGEPMVNSLTRLLDDWLLKPRPVFLSIDIDGFSSAVAPGCSQSWATGFMPDQFFPCLTLLSSRLDVRALGIYEVSPPLDQDNRTAKLAAQIIHRVIS